MSDHAPITFFAKPQVKRSRRIFIQIRSRTDHERSRETQNRWLSDHATDHGSHAPSDHENHHLYKRWGFGRSGPPSSPARHSSPQLAGEVSRVEFASSPNGELTVRTEYR